MASIMVIFDLDGTLVDSEPVAGHAMRDMLPQLNETPHQLMLRYRGWRFADVMIDFERRLGTSLPADFETRYRQRMSELFPQMLKAVAGVVPMLRQLQAAGTPMCIASNGPLFKMRETLGLAGLSEWFGSNLFSAYEVGAWKPDPALFVAAARAMAVEPAACVVVEDSSVGIRGAAAAGMRCLHYLAPDLPLAEGHPMLDPISHPVVARFSDMAELPGLLAGLR